jgi:phosphatidylglycerol---prolipoprotein diacylglyceryl transferase
MYPTISEFLKSFGIDLPLPIQTFGFFVAMAFMTAAYTLRIELRRKAAAGLIPVQIKRMVTGRPAPLSDYLITGFFGLVAGFKLVYLVTDYLQFVADPQGSLLSLKGSIPGAIAGAALMVWLKYREDKKQRLEKPVEKQVQIRAEDHLGNIVLLAVVGGLAGAKVFHNLENPGEFFQDPIGSLFSFSGLTFYGGLIVAAWLIIRYARRNGIAAFTISDAIVPGLMLAYGIGRIGCHTSGDGDWGILNAAYLTTPDGKALPAEPNDFRDTAGVYLRYYQYAFEGVKEVETVDDIPHASLKAPAGLPSWTVAFAFPRNVNNDGVPLYVKQGDSWQISHNERWNRRLPIPVFPTSLYEALAGILLFSLMWFNRKRIKAAGMMTGLFMLFNGLERFFIEKIRVNTEYQLLGMGISQAEIISFLLIIAGMYTIWYARKQPK